jgi:hypothetical protein
MGATSSVNQHKLVIKLLDHPSLLPGREVLTSGSDQESRQREWILADSPESVAGKSNLHRCKLLLKNLPTSTASVKFLPLGRSAEEL